MSLVSRLWAWLLSWLPWRDKKWLAVFVEDEPPELKQHRVYLITEDNEVWQAAFICPCGCQATIQLCCLREARPSWSYEVHTDRTVTIRPSVWRTKDCRSHFFLKRGLVRWCG